ncbi:MAG: PAS domain S-box protein [Firmicutes bacterium]|nr:PAS domain S-box protein [Bacillota bacterium]
MSVDSKNIAVRLYAEKQNELVLSGQNAKKGLISAEVCSILNSLNEIVWSVESESLRLIYISHSAEGVFCRNLGEFEANTELWLEIVHPLDKERVVEFFRTIPEMEKTEIHYRILRPNRECRYVKHKAFKYPGGAGAMSVIKGIITDITELMSLQDNLKISKERYEAVVQGQTELIKRYFVDTTITFVNDAYCRFFGAKVENLVGTSFMNFVPGSQRRRISKIIDSISKENNQVEFEYEVKRYDGEKRWIKWNDRAILDEKGQIIEIQSVGRDITEKKIASKLVALQKDLGIELSAISELKEALSLCLKTALKASGLDCGSIYLLNDENQEFELQAWEGMSDSCAVEKASFCTKTRQAKMLLKGHPVYMPYDKLSDSEKRHKVCGALKGVALIPIKIREKIIGSFNLGSKVYAEIPQGSKNALEAIAAQVGNTIDRIRSQEAVWESRRNLNLLFDSIGDFIFIINFNMTVINVNNEVLCKLGYAREEIIGKSLCTFHGENISDLAKEISKTIIEGKNGYCLVSLRARDGRMIPVETKITYGKWDDEDVLIGISRDISDRLRLEHDLENKDKELHDFTYTVSHDLRNPVNVLKSFLVAIKEDPELFDGYFERVLKQSDRLKHFIDDMISLSRASRTVVETMPVNLVCMLNRVFADTCSLMDIAEISISHDFVKMESDPARMERLFSNLFNNSSQYFGQNNKKLLIDISFVKKEGQVEIRFRDNGSGVEEANIEKIFEVGFTFNKNVRNGFGLPVCRKIVEAHGGRMWAENNSTGNGHSGGLTFIMSFPENKFIFEQSERFIRV